MSNKVFWPLYVDGACVCENGEYIFTYLKV